MSINIQGTEMLRSKIKDLYPWFDYHPGELLIVRRDAKFTYMRNKFKPLLNGYPVKINYPDTLIDKTVIVGTPFMFLGWAAYSHQYFSAKDNLLPVANNVTAAPECLYGMNILVHNKLFFLTCNYGYSIGAMRYDTNNIPFIRDVLPNTSKARR